jgi:adenylate kinase
MEAAMIFISGVHGSGKSYLCERIKATAGYPTYSASKLISERKQSGFAPDKLIPDIDDNQQYLLTAVRDLNSKGEFYLLDGHFCLLNTSGEITRIPQSTFTTLNPSALVLVTAEPETIAVRRRKRDGVAHNTDDIRRFQDEETAYASEIASLLDIPLQIHCGDKDFDATLEFIQANIRRV